MAEPDLEPSALSALLRQASLEGPVEVNTLAGGANNRAYRVVVGGQPYFAKWYFHDAVDRRDRLGAEYSFVSFAWNAGLRWGPRPVAVDYDRRLGLYEFIVGTRPAPDSVTEDDVMAAAEFVRQLNEHRRSEPAAHLRAGAEACFSLDEHIELVRARVARLGGIRCEDDVDRDAQAFVREELAPLCEEITTGLRTWAISRGADPSGRVRIDEICLSPSDFGFHNAIRQPEGGLRFVDFEYAGWDDAARMVADFFHQPSRPVPPEFEPAFTARALEGFANVDAISERASAIQPLYAVKWACIVLNIFLDVGRRRREFAGSGGDAQARRIQLEKARFLMERAGSYSK